jgi:hypothetical protein
MRIVRQVALAGAVVTGASAAFALGVGAQEADSPELSMAKAIMRDAPASGFAETAASTRIGSSGPVNGAAMMSPGYDALSGLSLSFVSQGYQRFWANKTGAGGLVGIIGIQLPPTVKPSAFLSDFDKSMKALDTKSTSVKELKDAKQATVTISGGQMHELAFTVGSRAFVVVGTGNTVSQASVIEVALRQQGYAGAVGGAAESAATQTAARATTNAPALPKVAPAQDTTVEGGFTRFLRTWVRFGCASLVIGGIAMLVKHLARPQMPAPAQPPAADPSMGILVPMAAHSAPTFASQQPMAATPGYGYNSLNPYVTQ